MMDSALVLITLASLGTTGAVLLYAARLIRDERARSHARVEALAQEISRAPAAGGGAPAPRGARPVARNAVSDRTARDLVHPAPPAPAPRSAIRTDSPPRPAAPPRDALGEAARFPMRHAEAGDESAARRPSTGPAAMFESASPESASGRWLVPAIGALVVVLALATIYFFSGQPNMATQPARATVADAPLELVSLRQARDGDSLTVSGTVRNPSEAPDRRQVAAVVFVFDRNGSIVASGRAPLDYQALGPGEESPFVITVPGASDVSRYRVSFREGDDVLPHVDRREGAPAAAAGQAAGTR